MHGMEGSNVWIFDSIVVGGADERPGCVQHAGYEDFRHLGGECLRAVAAWLVTDRSSFTTLWRVEPKYMLLGGAIGAVITYTVIKGMEMLGPARAVMIIVISQLIVAYLIELFGLFGVEKQPLEMRKIVGMGIAIAGIVIFFFMT